MLLFVMGIPLASISVACEPLILSVTPRELIGHVLAIIALITTLAAMLGWVPFSCECSNKLCRVTALDALNLECLDRRRLFSSHRSNAHERH
jgi:hypothetical protein